MLQQHIVHSVFSANESATFAEMAVSVADCVAYCHSVDSLLDLHVLHFLLRLVVFLLPSWHAGDSTLRVYLVLQEHPCCTVLSVNLTCGGLLGSPCNVAMEY